MLDSSNLYAYIGIQFLFLFYMINGNGDYKMKVKIILILSILFLAGCSMNSLYRRTIDDYMLAAPKVNLGMTKEEVIKILKPSQSRLKNIDIKHPDTYEKDGVLIEILYFRSGWQKDGIITDEEFTPYVFHDKKLVSIGWASLGGPKSHAQSQPKSDVNSTTVINSGRYLY